MTTRLRWHILGRWRSLPARVVDRTDSWRGVYGGGYRQILVQGDGRQLYVGVTILWPPVHHVLVFVSLSHCCVACQNQDQSVRGDGRLKYIRNEEREMTGLSPKHQNESAIDRSRF